LAAPVQPASAAGSGPAFYTWQAPGGAGTAGARVVALTFDDGPSAYTPGVLSVLEQYHVPATFFEVGEEVPRYPQYARLLTSAGYPVENHTWSHPDLTTLPPGEVGAQIDQAEAEIQTVTGTTPVCLRPPYDAFNATVLNEVAARGMTTMSYSVDSKDWTRPGVGAIVQDVVGASFPGAVIGMHDGGGDRSETVAALPQIITQLRARGYGFVSVCGGNSGPQVTATYGFGNAPTPGAPITSNLPLVGAALAGSASPASGYWEDASDGGTFSFGTAAFHGSMGGQPLNAPIVGMAATSDGNGYWEDASDGGIFSFGTAAFHGSMGGQPLNAPIVGMAATPDGNGYWEVASDGGIFSFGSATFHGSMGGQALNEPIVGMAATPDGNGYWEVASDGGIFSFGTAAFHGSMGGQALNAPIVGMAPGPPGGGYWELAADGGVFSFDVPFYGSRGGQSLVDRFFAMVATPDGSGYLLAGQHPPP
jgi:peptidoglycan/xylan/chitin deacetylase (PgdA/CDA1 family)